MKKTIILIIFILFLTSCYNKNYLENQKYCEKDSDCKWSKGCCTLVPVNKYQPDTLQSHNCEMLCKNNSFDAPINITLKCINNTCSEEPLITENL